MSARLLVMLLAIPAALAAQADSLTARLEAAIRRYERGERAEAMQEFRSFIGVYNAGASRLSSRDLVAVARAVTYLGIENPQLFRDALRAYDRAIEADPDNLDARVRLAELFLEKYNSGDARRTLAEALGRNPRYVPALVADARRRDFDHERGADSLVSRALDLAPDHVPARVLRARLRADVEDFAGAKSEIERALRVAPNDADALAFGAALHAVTADSAATRELRRRYASLYPREAGVQVATAELLARVRQYAAAADVAREGVRIDPQSWAAHAHLGNNLLRLGDVAAARASLETAFKGDPYNVWSKNTLDLLDTFGQYAEVRHGDGRFLFMIDTTESALLSLYLKELSDRAYTTFAQRYGYRPRGPIRVEVYRSHADFSVRTVGLAGLGALGVSFGNTIAFDSPGAREAGGGAFNWASTAWHELAHTFTLGATDHRIPRWFSEGLSVFEERRARPGWGQNVSPAFLEAFAEGKLVPASRLNDGFVRPAYPRQVQFSYFAASLLCDLIARDWGERALVDMLGAFREGLGTAQTVRRVLRIDLPELDRRFDAYIRERFGHALAALRNGDDEIEASAPTPRLVALAASRARDYRFQVAVGRALLQRGAAAEAIAPLERARALFPEYGGADSPYPWLVRARLAQGDRRGATTLLATLVTLGDVPYDAHIQLVDQLLAQGDTARAADALEGAMYVHPYDVAQHQRLATLYARLGERAKAVRERAAVVALKPVDRADALYQLAVSYREAGDLANAKRSVLYALEEAPHFERAQELLLFLHEGRQP